jgi:hypothetical protein
LPLERRRDGTGGSLRIGAQQPAVTRIVEVDVRQGRHSNSSWPIKPSSRIAAIRMPVAIGLGDVAEILTAAKPALASQGSALQPVAD